MATRKAQPAESEEKREDAKQSLTKLTSHQPAARARSETSQLMTKSAFQPTDLLTLDCFLQVDHSLNQ